MKSQPGAAVLHTPLPVSCTLITGAGFRDSKELGSPMECKVLGECYSLECQWSLLLLRDSQPFFFCC